VVGDRRGDVEDRREAGVACESGDVAFPSSRLVNGRPLDTFVIFRAQASRENPAVAGHLTQRAREDSNL
jgi:hypothetical protein